MIAADENDVAATSTRQYSVFISYPRESDESSWARWLQRRLESYVIPRRLRKNSGNKRLKKAFLDDSDLTWSPTVRGALTRALADSDLLVVICSPRAVDRVWVNEEIAIFANELQRPTAIVPVLVAGDLTTSLPEGLRSLFASASTMATEPLVIDLRGDNILQKIRARRRGLVRLFALLLGSNFDDLWRREVSRRRRRFAAAGVTALVFAALLAVQTWRSSENESRTLTDYARHALESGLYERSARIAALAARERPLKMSVAEAAPTLATAVERSLVSLSFPTQGTGGTWTASPDGSRVLSYGGGANATVWDGQTGTVIASMAHPGGARGAAFAFSEDRVVSWGANDVKVWDVKTGATVATHSHRGAIADVVVSPDGTRVLSRDADEVGELWTANEGTVLKRWRNLNGAAFSNDGRRVFTWSGSDAEVIDPVSGLTLKLFENGAIVRDHDGKLHRFVGQIAHAALNESGERVLIWSEGGATVWSTTSGRRVVNAPRSKRYPVAGLSGATFVHGDRVLSWGELGIQLWDAGTGAIVAETDAIATNVAVASDGTSFLLWHDDFLAHLWKPESHDLIELNASAIRGALFAKDSQRALTWDANGTVYVWDSSGRQIAKHTHAAASIGAVFLSKGDNILSWSREGASIRRAAPAFEQFAGVKPVLSADGKKLFVMNYLETATVLDIPSGASVAFRHSEVPSGGLFLNEDKWVASWAGTEVVVWDAQSGEVVSRHRTSFPVFRSAASLDGRHVVSWGMNPSDGRALVSLWSPSGETPPAEFETGFGAAEAVFSADCAWVLCWNFSSFSLRDSRTGQALFEGSHDLAVEQFTLPSIRASFLKGGFVVSWSSSRNDRPRIWDPAIKKEVFRLPDPISLLEVSGDGWHLLSAHDNVATVWDVTAGNPPTKALAHHRHGGTITGGAISRDGSLVALWSGAGTELWDTQNDVSKVFEAAPIRSAAFDAAGRRLLLRTDSDARLLDTNSGVLLGSRSLAAELSGATFSGTDRQVLVWGGFGGIVWDVGWSAPRPTNNDLIADVCERSLRGPEDLATRRSVRRISEADAVAVPLLQGRVDEDVCAKSAWPSMLERTSRYLWQAIRPREERARGLSVN